jgi:hypothetical protein
VKHKPTLDWKSKSTEGIRQRERERERREWFIQLLPCVRGGGSVWDEEEIACVGMCVCVRKEEEEERENENNCECVAPS